MPARAPPAEAPAASSGAAAPTSPCMEPYRFHASAEVEARLLAAADDVIQNGQEQLAREEHRFAVHGALLSQGHARGSLHPAAAARPQGSAAAGIEDQPYRTAFEAAPPAATCSPLIRGLSNGTAASAEGRLPCPSAAAARPLQTATAPTATASSQHLLGRPPLPHTATGVAAARKLALAGGLQGPRLGAAGRMALSKVVPGSRGVGSAASMALADQALSQQVLTQQAAIANSRQLLHSVAAPVAAPQSAANDGSSPSAAITPSNVVQLGAISTAGAPCTGSTIAVSVAAQSSCQSCSPAPGTEGGSSGSYRDPMSAAAPMQLHFHHAQSDDCGSGVAARRRPIPTAAHHMQHPGDCVYGSNQQHERDQQGQPYQILEGIECWPAGGIFQAAFARGAATTALARQALDAGGSGSVQGPRRPNGAAAAAAPPACADASMPFGCYGLQGPSGYVIDAPLPGVVQSELWGANGGHNSSAVFPEAGQGAGSYPQQQQHALHALYHQQQLLQRFSCRLAAIVHTSRPEGASTQLVPTSQPFAAASATMWQAAAPELLPVAGDAAAGTCVTPTLAAFGDHQYSGQQGVWGAEGVQGVQGAGRYIIQGHLVSPHQQLNSRSVQTQQWC